jgi:hypothetical protein
MRTVGDKCTVCGFPHFREVLDGGDTVNEGCSEFCARESDEVIAKFKAGFQEGEYGIFPCSECGEPMEGEWTPGAWCYSCSPKRSARIRGELLKECLVYLPESLSERVKKELGQ